MDAEAELLIPADDEIDPQISIVVPALNEELTIADFIDWCREGLRDAGRRGEILIVDSSTDRTAQIALAKGARVLRVPKRGLGRAYIDALPHIRSPFAILGDCDCTYDFRELTPFVEKFDLGYEFVMGSRYKGGIEKGAMPRHHQYFGTPLTTALLDVIYSRRFSDIHCGMRGITTDAFRRIHLQSQSWEYASEMIVKSVHHGLRTAEVPVHFYKDRNGRVSHHRRAGWFSPFAAAWINMRAMFVFGAEFFVFRPGIVALLAGLILTLPLIAGPVTIGPITFSIYWMLLGVTLTLLGLQSFFFGCLGKTLHDASGQQGRRWKEVFSYDRTVLITAIGFAVGLVLSAGLVANYVHEGLRLPLSAIPTAHRAVFGILLMISSFMTFGFVLLLHATVARLEEQAQ